MKKIKVLIVDDSAVVRELLNQNLNADPEIEVVGTAMDPLFAMEKIMRNPPDVITLDVEMPRMDGLTFLGKLMDKYPIPVVMISSLTQKGAETTMKALELGAVDFIAKPGANVFRELPTLKQEIITKVKQAAQANLRIATRKTGAKVGDGTRVNPPTVSGGLHQGVNQHTLVVLGASTGGVTAVTEVIKGMGPGSFSVLVVVHMPAGFTTSFAQRLNGLRGWHCSEAQDGELLQPGHIYVAPGGQNTVVRKTREGLALALLPVEPNDVFKPNINKTFASVAQTLGPKAIGVIMTGMGDDGSRGLLLMQQKGACTLAQNRETCMIYGMPNKAVEIGAVQSVLPLNEIGPTVMQLVGKE